MASNMKPLAENAVIGIIGGGQLGRMSALAAAALGYRAHVFAPKGDAPATDIAKATRADYTDTEALATFAQAVDSIICEFENVPVAAMDFLAQHRPVCPGSQALQCAQHRLNEKDKARALGIPTPRYVAVKDAPSLKNALTEFGGGILKTCRLGYDGKGQLRLDATSDAVAAFANLKSDDLILEEFVNFTAEVSFLVARAHDGSLTTWAPSLNQHRHGILHSSEAPAPAAILRPALAKIGTEAVIALAENLDLRGVLAVEMFVTSAGQLLFNEMAPRPHNSFHWTIEGAETSQFSQLIRIAAGLPLASTKANGHWRMTNILGEDLPRLDTALAEDGIYIHRYGKAEARQGRKMAHLNQRLTD